MSRANFALLIALVGVLFAWAAAPPPSSQPAPPPAEWRYRRSITLTNVGPTDLRDFQARLVLHAQNFDFDLARPDGGDLRFADEDGRRYLPHWVEHYDAVARQAVVWIKTPHIPSAGRRRIYLYYGSATADDLSSGGRTFEMFDDFGRPGLGYYIFGPPTTVMTRTAAWETEAPHTLSVVELNRDGYRYWGYYGLADCGGIGLARSNDLVRWVKWPEPLLNRDGERWPSVQKVGDRLYMIYDRDHCGVSHLVMRTSADGVHFDSMYRVVVPQEVGIRNQNPALFRDPQTGMFYLYWFRGGSEAGFWQIKMRRAWSVEGLINPTSERVLLDVPYELAAPNMMFHNGAYFLSTEVNENAWKTKIYVGPSPAGPFTPLPDAPQLSDNQACLFQHIFAATLHAYICKDTGAGWVLNHRSADLSAGRSARRQLDPGVWTALGGVWVPIEIDAAVDARVALGASGEGLLMTALPGGDYVFEARGRLQDPAGKWGLAVRVQDEDNQYRVEVERSADGDALARVYRVVNGAREVELAGASNVGRDPLDWLKLSVAIRGNEMRVRLNDGHEFAAADPQARFASGRSGLWVAGSAQFDDVVWRKVAVPDPEAVIGPREQNDASLSNWLGRDQAVLRAADAASHQRHTWLAASLMLIALGLVALGSRHSRR
ncbi:MAG: hypothetical protein CUN48_08855 [Candidatus Thermofonsia Clade 3 bacterium]|uniref:DUF2341 domain-containing protein n=1 Tax=Candidatus Thermofonsia Clade 3 bacterium TaxID=2364212 RepID=A0A2M8QC79_9CHLR|nr:MAG: hypothetical protein CUN48_08855 [Candidatus Thermofonsia Clade 3 bacterium]